MSAAAETLQQADLGRVTIRRDSYGVVLRYFPEAIGLHHTERQLYRSDGERMALLQAEIELATLESIAEYLSLSEIGFDRINEAISVIRDSLGSWRNALGMESPSEIE